MSSDKLYKYFVSLDLPEEYITGLEQAKEWRDLKNKYPDLLTSVPPLKDWAKRFEKFVLKGCESTVHFEECTSPHDVYWKGEKMCEYVSQKTNDFINNTKWTWLAWLSYVVDLMSHFKAPKTLHQTSSSSEVNIFAPKNNKHGYIPATLFLPNSGIIGYATFVYLILNKTLPLGISCVSTFAHEGYAEPHWLIYHDFLHYKPFIPNKSINFSIDSNFLQNVFFTKALDACEEVVKKQFIENIFSSLQEQANPRLDYIFRNIDHNIVKSILIELFSPLEDTVDLILKNMNINVQCAHFNLIHSITPTIINQIKNNKIAFLKEPFLSFCEFDKFKNCSDIYVLSEFSQYCYN